MNYRGDIDGLRAVAVLAVVFFHAHVTGFSGGYVGVDVFFVISGYLITRLLVADFEQGRYSLLLFYERRIRRLFPALFAVLAVASALGWWLLLPDELRRFGASLAATSVFGSNLLFWREGDYFAAPAESKPLLHTWSLAVEEQFYLFFPLLLPWLLRMPERTRAWAVALAMGLSFALAAWLVMHRPATAFYLAPLRAWELLLGAVLALGLVPALPSQRVAELAAWTGIGLIVGSVVLLDKHSVFPGLSALAPCLGAALVIHSAQGHRTMVAAALSLRPVVFIGLVSYSLYLWHWVALAYARIDRFADLTSLEVAAALTASFVLAVLSWRFIEAPVRRNRALTSRAALFAFGIGGSMIFFALGAALWAARGVPERLPPAARQFAGGTADAWWGFGDCDRRFCIVQSAGHAGRAGGDADVSVLLWGDSHAAALAPAFERSPGRVVIAFDRGCPPLMGLTLGGGGCERFARSVLERVRDERIGRVVLHARWAMYVEGTRFGREEGRPIRLVRGQDNASAFEQALRSTLRQLQALGVDVHLVGPVPEAGKPVPGALARVALRGGDLPTLPQFEFEARQSRTRTLLTSVAASEGLPLIDLHDALCDGDRCRLEAQGRSLYFDDDHLSTRGAALVAPMLAQTLWPETGSLRPTSASRP